MNREFDYMIDNYIYVLTLVWLNFIGYWYVDLLIYFLSYIYDSWVAKCMLVVNGLTYYTITWLLVHILIFGCLKTLLVHYCLLMCWYYTYCYFYECNIPMAPMRAHLLFQKLIQNFRVNIIYEKPWYFLVWHSLYFWTCIVS